MITIKIKPLKDTNAQNMVKFMVNGNILEYYGSKYFSSIHLI